MGKWGTVGQMWETGEKRWVTCGMRWGGWGTVGQLRGTGEVMWYKCGEKDGELGQKLDDK